MFRKLGFFNWFWFILNAGLALLLLASYFAVYVTPTTFWPMAFIGLAYPFLLLINILFIIFWGLKLHRFALLSIIIVVIGWKTHKKVISFDFTDSDVTEEKSPNSIRIMTYNAHFFQPFTGDYDAAFKREMLQVIYNQKPDILCIQEFYTRYKGEFNILDSLIKKLKYKHYYFDKSISTTYSQQGVIIFSKYPIKNKGSIVFNSEKSSNRAIYVDITIDNQLVRLFDIHLQSISFQPEDYQYLKTLKKELDINEQSTRNIGFRLKRAFKRRSVQAQQVADAIAKSPYPVLVCGDFNDTPMSYAYHTIAENLKNTFQEKGKGYARTYTGAFPNFQIDYILCSKEFEVLNHQVIKKELSDHFPVRSDVLLH